MWININLHKSISSFYLTNNSESCLCVLSGAIRLWNVDHEKNLQRQRPVSSHAISMPHPGSEMVWQDHQCRNKGSTTGLMDLPSLIIDRRHSLFGHICQGHTCFTSTTSIHWWLHWHTSCHWLEALTGPSTENLASTGGRKYGSTISPCQFATLDRLSRSLRPSAGRAQQWVSFCVCLQLLPSMFDF